MHRTESCRLSRLYVLIIGCLAPAWGCTVFEFADSGFAANAIHLMHAVPIFDGNNGTFFLDNSQVSVRISRNFRQLHSRQSLEHLTWQCCCSLRTSARKAEDGMTSSRIRITWYPGRLQRSVQGASNAIGSTSEG